MDEIEKKKLSNDKKLKRFVVELDPIIKRKIRLIADIEQQTMSNWVRLAILRQIYEFENKDK